MSGPGTVTFPARCFFRAPAERRSNLEARRGVSVAGESAGLLGGARILVGAVHKPANHQQRRLATSIGIHYGLTSCFL
jgi:hypothetical protein